MEFKSVNFGFLAKHEPVLVKYGALAERYVFTDPNTALLKLRQFAELLANQAAAYTGVYTYSADDFSGVLRSLKLKGLLNGEVSQLFYGIKEAGNRAAHAHAESSKGEALQQLRMARELAVWFQRSFGKNPTFKPGAFIPPPEPKDATKELTEELKSLRDALVQKSEAEDKAKKTAEQEARFRQEAEAKATRAYQDLETALQLAEETEEKLSAERKRFNEELKATQKSAERQPEATIQAFVENANVASQELDLNEKDTRKIIDEQLRQAGWEVDTQQLRYSAGTRPQKHKTMAIAEWPTKNGPADYVLFNGLTPIAVVEAKRGNKNVAAIVYQAGKYSIGFEPIPALTMPSDTSWGEYKIPFLFSANGRPYLKQIEELSGVWFHDVRRKSNHPHALEGWYSPADLVGLLSQDIDEAEKALKTESTDYLPLRPYQMTAIQKVEEGLLSQKREMLLAMATGTGKTRVAVCMIYRFLKSKRFRRILFLVDRTSLGTQLADKMAELQLENFQTLPEIYDVKEIGEIKVDKETKLHVSTIQGVIKRLFYSAEDAGIPVGQYDCIIVDECHRGYTLDREMSDLELGFRSEEDYISKYRRALDHFDAVKIGLTATPALHTTEIFGAPIYTYSYREAVIDEWLVDQEPPIGIVTKLGKDGIRWAKGEEITIVNTKSAQIELFKAPDEVHIEIEKFNKEVITENFNRVVLEYLATQIDPTLPGKTLIFCVSDLHADLVVKVFKEELEKIYGPIDDQTVLKITGASKPDPQGLFKRYQNEKLPSVAVTVDLLTTGIDVEEITNIVFLRRVKSRILFEQMIGRATRLCPNLYGPGEGCDKESFRVFDAVDIYSALEDVSTMKPVVVNPKLTFEQLITELKNAKDDEQRQFIKEQIIAKLQRKKRSLRSGDREKFANITGKSPEEAARYVRDLSPEEVLKWFSDNGQVISLLDIVYASDGARALISDHPDRLEQISTGFGDNKKPEDYLLSLKQFLLTNKNQIPALLVVMQRPRELTRAQLREIKTLLDKNGFSEVNIQTAWRQNTNQDIAATIIGYIRTLALGSPLIPYRDRVDRAMKRVLASRAWTRPQEQWLKRIGKQLLKETVVDKDALNSGQFMTEGGFNRINKVFEGKLESVLSDLNEALWTEPQAEAA